MGTSDIELGKMGAAYRNGARIIDLWVAYHCRAIQIKHQARSGAGTSLPVHIYCYLNPLTFVADYNARNGLNSGT
jgi:hypothetical protein